MKNADGVFDYGGSNPYADEPKISFFVVGQKSFEIIDLRGFSLFTAAHILIYSC